MSNMKKVLSVVMAVVMALGVFSICAFAATETATWSLSVSSTTVAINDVITVSVAVSTDYYMATTGIPVFYDKTAFEYVAASATLTDIFGAGATAKTSSNNAVSYPATISSTTYGVLYALYVPLSNQPGVAAPKYATSTTILTFQLKAIANVTNAQIFLSADAQKTEANIGGNFFSGSYPTSDVTGEVTTVGQIFTLTNAAKTVTVGSSTPVLSSLSSGVVDSTNHYVYGVPAGTAATVAAFGSYFSVANGSFTISGNGTGATLTVKTTGGATYATYTLVIFGDVNGDGTATLADYVSILNSVQGTALTGVNLVAADVNGSGGSSSSPEVTLADYVGVLNGVQGSTISVNPYA